MREMLDMVWSVSGCQISHSCGFPLWPHNTPVICSTDCARVGAHHTAQGAPGPAASVLRSGRMPKGKLTLFHLPSTTDGFVIPQQVQDTVPVGTLVSFC